MKDLYLIKQRISASEVLKHNPIYDTAMYWSQKSFSIADILIEEFTSKEDIVFDPFMGSGVSIIESVSDKNKRNAIGSEINEVPIFITKMALKKMVPETITRLDSFLKKITNLYSSLYSTNCPKCGSVGTINKIIFDKTDTPSIKNINFKCSNAKCNCTNKMASESDYEKMYGKYKIQEIKDHTLIYNSKIAVSEGMKISNIFTPRNFKALDNILYLKNTEYQDIKELIDYILLSMIHLCKITDTHSNSQWPLWTPKVNCVEKNVFQILERKIKKISNFISYKAENYKLCEEASPFLNNDKTTPTYQIFSKGTQNLLETDVPDSSIDFILTDPPYLGQVLYSEYMQLYEPFLNFKINLNDEIVVSSAPSRNIKEKDYFDLLQKAFTICSKKLKNLHYMAMYFHDCNLTVWNNLIKILESCNFQYLSQVHIDKTVTLKNIISPKKSLNGDAILFFIKVEKLERLEDRTEWSSEIETNIYLEAKKMLSKGPLSTPELYDNGLMEIIIQNGWLNILSTKYKSLVDLFEKYFIWDKDTARWTI